MKYFVVCDAALKAKLRNSIFAMCYNLIRNISIQIFFKCVKNWMPKCWRTFVSLIVILPCVMRHSKLKSDVLKIHKNVWNAFLETFFRCLKSYCHHCCCCCCCCCCCSILLMSLLLLYHTAADVSAVVVVAAVVVLLLIQWQREILLML